jgi:membrane associated rhomboid family serine protease
MLRVQLLRHHMQHCLPAPCDSITHALMQRRTTTPACIPHARPPANVAVFFGGLLPDPLRHLVPRLQRACLQPRLILKGGDWQRLIWSALVHADEYHLYYNLSSLLWKGVRLEGRLGSVKFAALTAELWLLSHGLMVVGAWALAEFIPACRWVWGVGQMAAGGMGQERACA